MLPLLSCDLYAEAEFSYKPVSLYYRSTLVIDSILDNRTYETYYNINDVIAVHDYDTKNLKTGDDVAYLGTRSGLEGKIIVHRIIRIEDSSNGGLLFTTKGVNSNVEDPVIRDTQILGKVTGRIPIITQINHLVRSQVGFFTLIFCPLVLVIVLEVLQTITDYQLEKNEIQRIEKEK